LIRRGDHARGVRNCKMQAFKRGIIEVIYAYGENRGRSLSRGSVVPSHSWVRKAGVLVGDGW
jgi:hypothetical protein